MIKNDYEKVVNLCIMRGWNKKEKYINDMVLEVELVCPYDLKKNEIYYFNSHTLKEIP